MSKFFFAKLALNNIKKNSKTYVPYIITCVGTIMMFYMMHAISINKGLNEIPGSASLTSILFLGTIVIGIFSTIFLFYTNSFLIKRRKKELGLYNVLGLEKKHIAKVLFYENTFVAVISFVIGLLGGVILNKLMFMLLLKLLAFKVSFGYQVSIPAIVNTIILFVSIFTLTLFSNLLQIKLANPIELLKGGQHGEKEPKTKWLLALFGFITLGLGYFIALSVKSPLSALNMFFIAVLLVIIGTYALFTAGSIVILKILRKKKNFYYKTKNFIAVSGMIYRMKQNAVGLANICILSTAVLVMISTTVSLYVGMEDVLHTRFPYENSVIGLSPTKEEREKLYNLVNETIKKTGVAVTDKREYLTNGLACTKQEDKFITEESASYNENYALILFTTVEDYNRIEGKEVTLADDEALLFTQSGDYEEDKIQVDDKSFRIKQKLDSIFLTEVSQLSMIDTYVLIVNNIEDISENNNYKYNIDFNVDEDKEHQMAFATQLKSDLNEVNIPFYYESLELSRQDFFALYGGLFFLGIFLGALFLMATVLIIYYKQISEGYDDKERFEIMQKVGISKSEIRKTIRSQVLMVFFLPLLFTIIHVIVAFPIITKLLALLNLTNQTLFAIATVITIIVFGIAYAIVFALTARTYYRIVE